MNKAEFLRSKPLFASLPDGELELLGRSLGKRLLRLAVIRALPRQNGALSAQEAKLMRPGWRWGFLRMVVGLVGLSLLGLGYLWALWDKDGRTWHDMAAGTAVVRVE